MKHFTIGSALDWFERVDAAKAARNNGNAWLEQFHLERIADEAKGSDPEWHLAALGAIDAGEYGELDSLIADADRREAYDTYAYGFEMRHAGDPVEYAEWRP